VRLAIRARARRAGIGPAAGRWLGHGEGRTHLAFNDGPQPALLLPLAADQREQVHVAVVGRRAVEAHGAEDRVVRLLVHRGPGNDRQPHAAPLLRRLRRPQARRFRLRAHGFEQIEPDVLVVVIIAAIGFERQHMFRHKRARALADVFEFGGEGEIHNESSFTLPCRGRAGERSEPGWGRASSSIVPCGTPPPRAAYREPTPPLPGGGKKNQPPRAPPWPPSATPAAPLMQGPPSGDTRWRVAPIPRAPR